MRSRGWFPLVFPEKEEEKNRRSENLFFLYEKGTREFLDKEDESTDTICFLFSFRRPRSLAARV